MRAFGMPNRSSRSDPEKNKPYRIGDETRNADNFVSRMNGETKKN